MRRNAFTRSGRRPKGSGVGRRKRPHTSYTPTSRSRPQSSGISSIQELTRRQHQFASIHKKRVRQHATCFLPKNFVDTKRLPTDLGNGVGALSSRHGQVVDAFQKLHGKMVDPEIHDNIKAKYYEDLFQIAVHFCRREQRITREYKQLRHQHGGLEQEIMELKDGYKSDYDLVLSNPSKSDIIKLKSSLEKLKTEIYTYKKEHMKGMGSFVKSTSRIGRPRLTVRTTSKKKKKTKKRRSHDDDDEISGESESEGEDGEYTSLIKEKFGLLEQYVVFLKKKISVLEQSDNDLKTLVGRFGSIRDLLKDNERLRKEVKMNQWVKKRFDSDVLLNPNRIFPVNREHRSPKELTEKEDDGAIEDDFDDEDSELDDDEDVDSSEEESEWGDDGPPIFKDEGPSEHTKTLKAILLNRKVRRKNLHYFDVKYLKSVIFALQNELFYYKDLAQRLIPFNRNNQVQIVQRYPMTFPETFPRKHTDFSALSQLMEDPKVDLLHDSVYLSEGGEEDLEEEIRVMEKRRQLELRDPSRASPDEVNLLGSSHSSGGSWNDLPPNSESMRLLKQKNLALTKVLEQRNLELVEFRKSMKNLQAQLEHRPGKFQLKELETSIRRQLMEISRLNALLEEKEKYYVFQERVMQQYRHERKERSDRMIEMMKQILKLRKNLNWNRVENEKRIVGCRTLHQICMSLLHIFFEKKEKYKDVFGDFLVRPTGHEPDEEENVESEGEEKDDNDDDDENLRKKRRKGRKQIPDNIMELKRKKKKKKKKRKNVTIRMAHDERIQRHERIIKNRNENFLNFTFTNAFGHYMRVLNAVVKIQTWWRGVSTRRKLLKEGYYLIKQKKKKSDSLVDRIDVKKKKAGALAKRLDRKRKKVVRINENKNKIEEDSDDDDDDDTPQEFSVVKTIDDIEDEKQFKRLLHQNKKRRNEMNDTFKVLPMVHKAHLSTVGWEPKNKFVLENWKKMMNLLRNEMLERMRSETRLEVENLWKWVAQKVKEVERKVHEKESIVKKDRKVQTSRKKIVSLGTQAGVTQIQNVNIIY